MTKSLDHRDVVIHKQLPEGPLSGLPESLDSVAPTLGASISMSDVSVLDALALDCANEFGGANHESILDLSNGVPTKGSIFMAWVAMAQSWG